MPAGFIERAFDAVPGAHPARGAVVSGSGKFVVTNGATTNTRVAYMWDPVDLIYRTLPFAVPVMDQFILSDDDQYLVGVNSAGTSVTIWSIDQTTGAFTELDSEATTGRMPVFLAPNIIVIAQAGTTTRNITVYTLSGGALTQVYQAVFGTSSNVVGIVPGPLPRSFYRFGQEGLIALIQLDATTYVPTEVATVAYSGTSIGVINGAYPNSDRTLLAVTCMGGGSASSPFVRVIRWTGSALEYVPTGAALATNFPRPGVGPSVKAVLGFVSKDNVMLTRGATGSEALLFKANAAGTDFQAFSMTFPTMSAPGTATIAWRVMWQSKDCRVTIHTSVNSPYIRVVEEVVPTATFNAVGIMGSASAQANVAIEGNIAGSGPMGSAAISAEVNIIANIVPTGLLGRADVVIADVPVGPDGFAPRPFDVDPSASSPLGAVVSPTGRFVLAPANTTAGRALYMWNSTLKRYEKQAWATALDTAAYSDDETLLVGVNTLGAVIVWTIDPVTGVHTQGPSLSGYTGAKQCLIFSPNVIVLSRQGARVIHLLTFTGSVITPQADFTPPLPTVANTLVYGPLPRSYYRVGEHGEVHLVQYNASTYAQTLIATTGVDAGIGSVGSAQPNADRTLLALTATGSAAANDPWVRIAKYDIANNILALIPVGAAGDLTKFPRADLKPANKVTAVFVSDEGALFCWAVNAGGENLLVNANLAGNYFEDFNEALMPIVGYSSTISRHDRIAFASKDNTIIAFSSVDAPYLQVMELQLPNIQISAIAPMGSADIEAEVAITADFGPVGLMGQAAIEAEVNIIVNFDAVGLMGVAALVAGTDDAGPDRKYVYLQDYFIVLDSGPVVHTIEYVGFSGLLDAAGPMGDAAIKMVYGEYGEIGVIGIMGSAAMQAQYDTAEAGITAYGLMGRPDIELEVEQYALLPVQGIMGQAFVVLAVPLPARFEAVGLMGRADLVITPPPEITIDAVGLLASATILASPDQVATLDSTGPMGLADIELDTFTIDIDATGIMGAADILAEITGEVARLVAEGIMGQAALVTEIVVPLEGSIDARGLMGQAEIIMTNPETIFIAAPGIMGSADIEFLNDEFARLDAMGPMGDAGFLINDGWRGDIRARGIMGVASIELKVAVRAQIDAVGIMGLANVELQRNKRTKRFFIIKPF